MPEQDTLRRANTKKREGKAPSTQAGEFVKEEIRHVREGKHGARSTKQAIAIGLSKARKAGVDLKPPRKGRTSERTRCSAKQAYEKGQYQPVTEVFSPAIKSHIGSVEAGRPACSFFGRLVQAGASQEMNDK